MAPRNPTALTDEEIQNVELDGPSPLEKFTEDIDIDSLPHKTAFTIIGESRGKSWESTWIIPKDIYESDWVEIQRMLKLAMTTLCRLPIDEAIGINDPENYERIQRERKEKEERLLAESSFVFGEREEE